MYKGDKWQYYDCIEKSVNLFLDRHISKGMMYSDIFCYDELISIGLVAFERCVNEYVDYSTCSFKSYLMRGLKLAYLSEWRKRTRIRADNEKYDDMCVSIVDDVDIEEYIVLKSESKEKELQLLKALETIQEEHAYVWVAYHYDDINMRDIARIYGSSYKKIISILDTVTKKLLYILENNDKFVY